LPDVADQPADQRESTVFVFILSWFLVTGKLFALYLIGILQPESPNVCYAYKCCDIIPPAWAFLPNLRQFCEGMCFFRRTTAAVL